MKTAILGLALLATQELSEKTYEKFRDEVLATKQERAFFDLPWQPTLWDGVVEGQKQEKPILFYVMNGNPLGCT